MSRLIVAFPKTLDNVSSDLEAYLHREGLIHTCQDPEFYAHPSSPSPSPLNRSMELAPEFEWDSQGSSIASPVALHSLALRLGASFDFAGVVQVKSYKFRVSTNPMVHGNTHNPRTS